MLSANQIEDILLDGRVVGGRFVWNTMQTTDWLYEPVSERERRALEYRPLGRL